MSDLGVLISLDEEVTESSKVVLDYTSRDFTAIRAQLVGLAKGMMPDWTPAGEPSDFGTLLLELFAYMGDVMHFYIDRTASEAFLGTAVRRNSVLYIADMMGYTPIGQSSAIVTLMFELDAEATEELYPDGVTIPKGTRVHNATNNASGLVVFELQNSVTVTRVPDPENPTPYMAEVVAMEGLTVRDTLLGKGTGVPNTEFIIPDKGVIYRSVSIVTREGYTTIQWDFITDLSLARPTQTVFTTYIDESEYTHIVFGDNAVGRIPAVNAEVFCTYRFGVGAAANDVDSGEITVILPDGTIEGIEFVSVRNEGPPVGGANPESIESMKNSIPRSAGRIKNRAVTLNDYADLALQVPGVAKSVAYGTVYTAVRIKIALSTPNGEADPEVMRRKCAEVEQYMQDKILVGSSVYVEPMTTDALWNATAPETATSEVYIRLLVHVVETYNRSAVRVQVETVVRKLLDYNTVNFGTRISVGAIYRAALAVQGVEWAELYHLSTNPPAVEPSSFAAGIPSAGWTDAETGLFSGTWQYETSTTTSTSPTAQHYRANVTTSPSVAPTEYAFNVTGEGGMNHFTDLSLLRAGDHIVIRQSDHVEAWLSMAITATPTNNTTWFRMTVALIDRSALWPVMTADTKVLFEFIRFAPDPDTLSGEVMDIDTPELLIPRIKPPLTLKKATVTNKALTANVATLTTSAPHDFKVGELIKVGGVDAVFNGDRYTITVVTSTTLSYSRTNANVSSTAATGTITQVDPARPEREEDFPGMTEEERTHDGLWVRAVGGLANS